MKRLTAVFIPFDSSISTSALREEVDGVLLRLHPRITYKMGSVTLDTGGRIYARIAMDGKRDLLDTALKSKVWKVQVQLDSIGWGWLPNGSETPSRMGTWSSDVDPLEAITPLDGAVEFRLSKRRLWLRYIILIIVTLLIIGLLVANVANQRSSVLEWLYRIVFIVWLIALNETPFDIRVYAEKVGCSQTTLAVKYRLMRQVVSLNWEDIWGLDYTEPICEMRCDGKKIRLLISERFGCKEQKTILKTIAERSKLNYVEGNYRKSIYRRFEAENKSG